MTLTITTALLALLFVMTLIPLGTLIVFLYRHRKYTGENGDIDRLRAIIFRVSIAKFFFLSGEIVSCVALFSNGEHVNIGIIGGMSILTASLGIANWWAFYGIRKII
jgi:hypothetical protein